MLKSVVGVAFLIMVFLSFGAWATIFNDLDRYQTPESVVSIFTDSQIDNAVKRLTGDQYREFIINFVAFGEPQQLKGGGLLVEGWLPNLRLENASVLVIEPNGNLYVAWVEPNSNYIKYVTNDPQEHTIHPDIKAWASRFNNMDFDPKPKSKTLDQLIPDVNYFSSNNYSAKITLICPDRTQVCSQVLMKITDKKDNTSRFLMGKLERADCEKEVCPVTSFKFTNENKHIDYILSLTEKKITISSGGKLSDEEKGGWS